MPLPLIAMAAKAAVPMLKKAAVNKLKNVAVKKAGQAISGATKGLVPSGVGEAVAGAAAKKALPDVFNGGGKMKVKKKKKIVAKGADRADVRGDRKARRSQRRHDRKVKRYNRKVDRYNEKNPDKPQMRKKIGLQKKDNGAVSAAAAGAGAAVGAATVKAASKKKKKFAFGGGPLDPTLDAKAEQDRGSNSVFDVKKPTKKSNAAQLEEKSEEAGKKRPTKEERKARRQEFKGKVDEKRAKAGEMRDKYEARAEKNKHHSAAMTAMSSYDKGGKMKPTDPKKAAKLKSEILSALKGGASDKEIMKMVKNSGLQDTYEYNWDNVEMKVEMHKLPGKGKKGDFGEPDKPGQRSDNFKGGGTLKSAVKAVRGAKVKYDKGGKEKSTPTTEGGKKYSELSPASRIKLQKSLQAQLNAAKSSRYASPEAAAADAASIQSKITHLNKFIPKTKPTTKASFRKGGKY